MSWLCVVCRPRLRLSHCRAAALLGRPSLITTPSPLVTVHDVPLLRIEICAMHRARAHDEVDASASLWTFTQPLAPPSINAYHRTVRGNYR